MTCANSSLSRDHLTKTPSRMMSQNFMIFLIEEHDVEVAYKKLLKDSLRLCRINDKLSHNMKVLESQSSIFSSERDDAHAKVSQLESQRAILFETVIYVGKEKELAIA